MQANFKYMRKLRRILSVAHGRRKKKILRQLIFVLNEIGKARQKKFEDQIRAFCANIIQKVWRGHRQRLHFQRRLKKELKSKRRLKAIIKGWRVRSILNRVDECITLRQRLTD